LFQPGRHGFRRVSAEGSSFAGGSRAEAASQGTAAAALDRNPELGLAANGGNPEPGLREREITQVPCEGSVSRPLAGKVEARQS
jgi:hypothetical protein